MNEFFSMGGYAAYVWPAYIITVVVLVGNVWFASRRHRDCRARARVYAARRNHPGAPS